MPKNTSLVKAHADYRAANARIKERQRHERNQELVPYLVALGAQIEEERKANGLTVEQIEAKMGTGNRALFYDAKNAFKAASKDEDTTVQAVETVSNTEVDGTVVEKTGANSARVTITHDGSSESFEFAVSSQGDYDFPDRWFELPDALVREADQKILEFWNGE